MNILNLSDMYGFLKNDKGEYVIVVHGSFLGPFTREQLIILKELIKKMQAKEQEG